ncbi:glycoside hydrolase family 27 protein [Reichenbachiella carrageenanivorans]|uniref:Alpha-galactosidase n=1 Tax=Reichenbachiella carrageenanivorans TaxID=2979869 RepID=A0ABY6D495_9BACT|nr:glycoside hydrolase family 27 protein [Reichenbachiella carrageenanivorans]UXX80965.1 glycoside hydrolase family 27 protein [Reichenbachiella carrageenanivorans]
MKYALSFFIVGIILLSDRLATGQNLTSATPEGTVVSSQKRLADTPPMGWNSWDCLGWTATEAQVKAAADYMDEHLKHLGYEYIVIDQGWFADSASSSFEAFVHDEISSKPTYTLDSFGRLMPDVIKYPSSKNGKGMKPLADYIHSKGLKFGLHLLRGIPWESVEMDMPIKDSDYSASSIGQPTKGCDWYDGFYGVDMTKPGGQAYYDSVFELFAEWGVDYVKSDDVINETEFLAISKAARNCGRDIVLSVVPANIEWEVLKENCDLARTGHDYWDVWQMLKQAFGDANAYTKYRGDGFWPDLDMLPVGKLGKEISYKGPEERISNFSEDELKTLLSLWYISQSPLMIGGYLPETDTLTLQLLTNEEAVAVSKKSVNSRQIKYRNAMVIWVSDIRNSEDKYLAMFNIWETFKPINMKVAFEQIGINPHKEYVFRDLWSHEDIGTYQKEFMAPVVTHGARLFKVSMK